MTGRIFQLNTSPGGVPKLAVREVQVTELGLSGDDHKFQDIHGGPERAVCLFSLERILELQVEGHPIFPGAVGENITISGIDWNEVRLGQQLALGNEVVLEITSYTTPCNSIPESFLDGKYQPFRKRFIPAIRACTHACCARERLRLGKSFSLMGPLSN